MLVWLPNDTTGFSICQLPCIYKKKTWHIKHRFSKMCKVTSLQKCMSGFTVSGFQCLTRIEELSMMGETKNFFSNTSLNRKVKTTAILNKWTEAICVLLDCGYLLLMNAFLVVVITCWTKHFQPLVKCTVNAPTFG